MNTMTTAETLKVKEKFYGYNKEDIERLKIYPTHVVNTLMDLVDYNFD